MRQSGQIVGGFALIGASLMLLLLPRSMVFILAIIGLFALGMAFITPNLSASISTWGDPYTGAALGMQNAANSLGQVSGPLLGAVLWNWNSSAPYLFAGVLLLYTGVLAAAKVSNCSHATPTR